MGKKLVGTLLLVLALVATQIPAPGANAASATDFRMDGTTLVEYVGTDSNVSIPATVTAIGAEAFADNKTISSITLTANLETIGYGAFNGCTSLKKVEIPNKVTSIGVSAFGDCTSLSSFTIGSGLAAIGGNIFAGCSSLKNITVNSGNKYYMCEDGVLYSKNKTIIYQVLAGRTGDSYTMPTTVTYIDDSAFWGCSNLKNVVVSSNLREIPPYAFSNCNGLLSIVIPYSAKAIQMKAFENCVKLQSVTITGATNYIHSTAFDGCGNLTIVTDTGTAAEQFATQYGIKTSTTPVTINPNITVSGNGLSGNGLSGNNVSGNGLSGNNVSTNVVSDNALATPDGVDALDRVEEGNVIGKTKIVNRDAVILMDNRTAKVVNGNANGNVASNVVGNPTDSSVTTGVSNNNAVITDNSMIPEQSYYRNADLTTYNIGSDVTTIGTFAFARSGLTSIVIPDGVTTIDYAAFYHCDSLADVIIPNTVTNIGRKAFAKTLWMDKWFSGKDNSDFLVVGDGILLAYKGTNPNVVIPEGVKQIGAEAFMGHTEITGVTLPNSLTTIREYGFSGCTSLSTLNGGANLTTTEDFAFDQCPIEVVSKSVSAPTQNSMGHIGNFQILEKTKDNSAYLGALLKWSGAAILAGIAVYLLLSKKRKKVK